MATNPFFNNTGNNLEQGLLDDLLSEAIKIHGIDFYYLPRGLNNKDEIYETDDISTFDYAYPIEMYVNWAGGFQGGSFLSQFGLEIRDQLNFMVSRLSFAKEVGSKASLTRPREGDLIYYPLNKKMFEIKFVDDKPIHYPMGTLPMYEMSCELYEYSDQRFDTGLEELDDIEDKLSRDLLFWAIRDENDNILVDESGDMLMHDQYDPDHLNPLENNDDFDDIADPIINTDEDNPFGYIDPRP